MAPKAKSTRGAPIAVVARDEHGASKWYERVVNNSADDPAGTTIVFCERDVAGDVTTTDATEADMAALRDLSVK